MREYSWWGSRFWWDNRHTDFLFGRPAGFSTLRSVCWLCTKSSESSERNCDRRNQLPYVSEKNVHTKIWDAVHGRTAALEKNWNNFFLKSQKFVKFDEILIEEISKFSIQKKSKIRDFHRPLHYYVHFSRKLHSEKKSCSFLPTARLIGRPEKASGRVFCYLLGSREMLDTSQPDSGSVAVFEVHRSFLWSLPWFAWALHSMSSGLKLSFYTGVFVLQLRTQPNSFGTAFHWMCCLHRW